MHKRDKDKGKAVPKQSASVTSTILPVIDEIEVEIPTSIMNSAIDQSLLKHYIKAKIMQKKKININQPISVMIFGKEQLLHLHLNNKERIEEKVEQNLQENSKIAQIYTVSNKLIIHLVAQKPKNQLNGSINKSINDIPKFYGDNTEYDRFKQIVLQNFKLRQKLFDIKLGAIRGIMLGGATGTGKSTFIRRLKLQLEQQQIQPNTKLKVHCISATQLLSRVVGGAEEYVRKIFQTLTEFDYAVLVIQDMHLLFGDKEISAHETTLVTLFLQMDKFQKALIVIGTYNSQRDLSSTVFQSGRFQKQITLNLPNHHQRLLILKSIFTDLNLKHQLSDDEIKQFNLRLNGFSIGQIKQVLRDAYILKGQTMSKQFLFQTLKQYRPAQIKQLIVQVPEVYWAGIGGYESVKHQIKKVTELPLKFPQKFQALGIQPSKGVLLYGPPGCSKTMMAKAIATESKLNFIGIKGPQLYSKYVGESQRAIRNVFRRARAFSPCIIFFDEIDALATQRNDQNDVTNRLLGQLLTEMDGVEGLKQVIVIAATNRPEILDQALTRPGRFDHLIYVGPPDLAARKQIFKICLKKTPLTQDIDTISTQLADRSSNYTGAQITLVCREAALASLQQNIESPIVSMKHFENALSRVKSRLNAESIARYQSFKAKLSNQETEQNKFVSEFGKMKIFDQKNNPFKL